MRLMLVSQWLSFGRSIRMIPSIVGRDYLGPLLEMALC